MASERRPPILAVDDKPAVLAALARDLRRGFARVLPHHARRLGRGGSGPPRELRRRGDQVALFIADQRMPAMSGTDYLVEAGKLVSDAQARVVDRLYMDGGELVEAEVHKGLETTLTVLGHKLKHGSIKVVRHYDRSVPRLTVRGSELPGARRRADPRARRPGAARTGRRRAHAPRGSAAGGATAAR